MLSASARRWPDGGEWVLQPKWDGYRLLIEVGVGGRVRAWSRHGASLTPVLADLIARFVETSAGSVFDGELIAIDERGGRPTQDFAAVGRAVFGGDVAAATRLRFVAFDVLAVAGQDLRDRPWRERDQRLAQAIPSCELVRPIQSLPASSDAHAAIVGLGFEGTVLKRANSVYRSGRHGAWLKHKARHTVQGVLTSLRQDRDGQWHGVCNVDGRRVVALAGASSSERCGQVVTVVFSRVDADGSLREARMALDDRVVAPVAEGRRPPRRPRRARPAASPQPSDPRRAYALPEGTRDLSSQNLPSRPLLK
jgi:hypothetical protein